MSEQMPVCNECGEKIKERTWRGKEGEQESICRGCDYIRFKKEYGFK